jgi:hypothetical protein
MLIPYITNVTKRVRYYSFYPWLCDQYARRKGDTSTESWQQYVRRAEALLALACCANKGGWVEGVSGIDWAVRHWRAHSQDSSIDFAKAALPDIAGGYLKASYGAFGQIYGGVLQELGLLGTVPDHSIPVPGLIVGDNIVKAYAKSVGDAGLEFLDVLEQGESDSNTLKRLGGVLTPGAIPEDSDERQLLEEALLNEDKTNIIDPTARWESLLLILHVANCLETEPSPDQIRWALYSKQLSDGTSLNLPARLLNRCSMWQAYQANELSHIAMEALLALLLEGISQDQESVTSVIGGVISKLLNTWQEPPASWGALRENLILSENPSDPEQEDSEANLARTVMDRGDPVAAAVAGVHLLAVLDMRWSGLKHSVGAVFGPGSLLGTRFPECVIGVLTFLRARETEPFEQTLANLVQRYVVEQHLRIALRKLYHQGKRTFLFELADGQFQKPLSTSPVLTNPRFTTSLAFLQDMHLLDKKGPTERGRGLLGTS